jgi:DNA-binding NtrC family response regulator
MTNQSDHSFSKEKPYLLIVDDDECVREVIECLLEEHYVVECVDKVDQALLTLMTTPIDVVLLDYRLPGGSSLVVAEYADQIGVPLIWMTGNAFGLVEADAGKHLIIEKPFHTRDLLTALATARQTELMSYC